MREKVHFLWTLNIDKNHDDKFNLDCLINIVVDVDNLDLDLEGPFRLFS